MEWLRTILWNGHRWVRRIGSRWKKQAAHRNQTHYDEKSNEIANRPMSVNEFSADQIFSDNSHNIGYRVSRHFWIWAKKKIMFFSIVLKVPKWCRTVKRLYNFGSLPLWDNLLEILFIASKRLKFAANDIVFEITTAELVYNCQAKPFFHPVRHTLESFVFSGHGPLDAPPEATLQLRRSILVKPLWEGLLLWLEPVGK